MNPALTPISRIREMSNAELIAFAKEHSHLTILEQEFLWRMDLMVINKIDQLRPMITRSK